LGPNLRQGLPFAHVGPTDGLLQPKQQPGGLALGGVATELLCMLFMYKIVFRKK
jgi:hypothetical protein